MVHVQVKKGEPYALNKALKQLKRAVNKAGILRVVYDTRFFENTREKKKRKQTYLKNSKKYHSYDDYAFDEAPANSFSSRSRMRNGLAGR